jgi:hypothetical protein
MSEATRSAILATSDNDFRRPHTNTKDTSPLSRHTPPPSLFVAATIFTAYSAYYHHSPPLTLLPTGMEGEGVPYGYTNRQKVRELQRRYHGMEWSHKERE